MSLPQRPPLPKPPPKAPPPRAPGAQIAPTLPRAPGAQAAPAASALPGRPAMAAPALPGRPAVPAAVPAAPMAQAPALASQLPQAAAPVMPAAPAAAASRSPVPLIDIRGLSPAMAAMMEAVHIYEDLLVEENNALRTGDSKTVAALLDRKMGATRLYQDRLRTVLGDGEITRALTPEQRTQVVSMVRSLEELAKENTVLLKANMGAIEQLFEVINTAARKMRKREVAYSQAGVIRDYHTAATTSLAYNHTV
jgi:hypothetical protein